MTAGGWDASAAAWIADMGDGGNFGRRHVLDASMLARIAGRGFRNALDIGRGDFAGCSAKWALPPRGSTPPAR